jgi:hypothetical protein
LIPQGTIGKQSKKPKRVDGYDGPLKSNSSRFIKLPTDLKGFNRKSNNRIFI